MAQTVSVIITAEERARLAAIVGDRSRPLKHVQRARIVLHSADRLSVLEVARRVSISRPAVWRWQRRYAEEGVDGLLHDKTRPAGTAPVPMTTVAKVLALTSAEPPGETTHWTGRAMAAAVGLSLRTIQRIWEAHRLQPHRLRTFKRSKDPAFAEKVEDIVGLYMRPPAHAIVLSIDEKSQIQALDRTQPGLPLKPGKCGTMTHDYKRHGTTTLFAAFKARTRWEFGVKVSLAVTNARAPGGQFVLGARACPENPYDGHTLKTQLDQVERLTSQQVARAYVDLGYRGHDAKAGHTEVFISRQRGLTSPTIKRELRRRSAVEPVIGHLKSDGLLERNHLAGKHGDAINLILAAAGHNLRLILAWLRHLCAVILIKLLGRSTAVAPA